MWHATIRLCVKETGFFGLDGKLVKDIPTSGGLFTHEVAHNINAIGDKKLNGSKMRTDQQVQRLARQKPTRGSWNAYNYQQFAKSR